MLFIWGKRVILSILVLSFISGISLCAQNETVHKYIFNNSETTSINFNGKGLTIYYSLPSVTLQGEKIIEGEFFRIKIPGHISSSEPGKPEFPILSRLIELPANGKYSIRVSNVKVKKITPNRQNIRGRLFPRQEDEIKSEQTGKREFIIDKSFYSRRGFAGPDTVSVQLLGKIRERRVATLNISPVRYNPVSGELAVITGMKVDIIFEDSPSKSLTAETALPFDELLSKGILNYSTSDVIPGYSDQPAGMIVLSDTAFRRYLQPFLQWKRQKGFKVTELYKGPQLAGNTFPEIKNTIAGIYNSGLQDGNAPVYLLIVGNTAIIPLSEGTSQVSDLYYGEFDGNGDYLPDMFIGRLPVADTAELRTVLNKIMMYEKFEFSETNHFYSNSLISAGNEPAYASHMNGQLKYADTNYLNLNNKIKNHVFYYPASAVSEDTIIKTINSGVGFINYTGHGDENGWIDPVFKVTQVNALTNKNMYPFVITNACRTGNYAVINSFGNRLINSKNKGASGFIGCSNDSYWNEDFYWAVGVGTPGPDPRYSETGLGALDRLFHTHNESPSDWYITMGQVNYAGNMAVSSSTSTKKKYYWETYTLLGDPSMVPFIGTPDTFNIQLPDTIPNGMTSLALILPPFTCIAISRGDTLWDATHASPSGSAILNLPGLSNDSCLIVITGQNKVPLIKNVYISELSTGFLNLTTSSVNDEGANNNGLADFDESFFLDLTVSNLGSEPANGVYVVIKTTDDDISLLSDSVYIGTLPGKTNRLLTGLFPVKVASEIRDMTFVTFDVKIKDEGEDKDYRIDLSLHAPDLEIVNCLIDDTGSGNGDMIADPGESFSLLFRVGNKGSSSISGFLKVMNIPDGVTMNQSSIPTGTIMAGETIIVPLSVTLSASAAKGSSFDIVSLLDCYPYIESKSFSIPVGKTRESFEYQTFSLFPWQNSATNPWIITSGQTYDGEFSARSALIPNSAESVIKININTPVNDTLKFMVRVSCENNYDFLQVKKNGKVIFSLTGETGWVEKKIPVNEGVPVIEWVYRKDQSVSAGSDCAWLDFINFPVLSLSRVDLKSNSILTPQPNEIITEEIITVQLVNLGADTVNTFNMAYQVNENTPVIQQFNKSVGPGDTATVEFDVKANMIKNGTYVIKSYGFGNNDSYLANDTAMLIISNTSITPVDNPDNRMVILPNPFSQSFRAEFYSVQAEEVRISLFDITGKLVFDKVSSVIPGENSMEINPDGLRSGFYNLIIRGKSMAKAARIIKKE